MSVTGVFFFAEKLACRKATCEAASEENSTQKSNVLNLLITFDIFNLFI